MTEKRNQSGERLSAALRELAASSRQGASAEAGLLLKDAFRRHHLRRKRMFRVRVALICVCLVVLALAVLLKRSAVPGARQPAMAQTIPPQEVSAPPAVSVSKMRPAAQPTRTPRRDNTSGDSAFVALPAVAVLPATDELRIVRLEISGEDLPLVGMPVTEELARRRLTADFVVGHDGTPYAMRLVRASSVSTRRMYP